MPSYILDPAEQEAQNDRECVARLMHRPRCACCGCPITTERYLDLEPFGLSVMACECCVERNFCFTDDLED